MTDLSRLYGRSTRNTTILFGAAIGVIVLSSVLLDFSSTQRTLLSEQEERLQAQLQVQLPSEPLEELLGYQPIVFEIVDQMTPTRRTELLERAQADNDVRAQLELGIISGLGISVPQNDTEAIRWYRLAVEQGDATAQFLLGLMYAQGRGVVQNDAEAVAWYVMSATQDDRRAQNNLGVMYARGRGVLQDDREALAWYRRASEQGSTQAQYNLGIMYARGRGDYPDLVIAHMWLNIAGSQSTGEIRAEIFAARDAVAEQMWFEEVNEAQRRAQQWSERGSSSESQ